MNFTIHGGYEIPRDGTHIVTRDNSRRREFWQEIEHDVDGLTSACGCYVVAIRGIPWYVGSAQRQDFKHECFSPHKITQYDAALNSSQGRPFLHLIARRTPKGRFCSTSTNGYRDIEFVENTFIGMALQRNEDLQNVRGTPFLRDMHIPGFVNNKPGEARAFPTRDLRSILGA
jgi:hypothetical protein